VPFCLISTGAQRDETILCETSPLLPLVPLGSARACSSMARPLISRLLFVVGRERRLLYDSLRRTFDGDDSVQVVLDRRVEERRQHESTRTRTSGAGASAAPGARARRGSAREAMRSSTS